VENCAAVHAGPLTRLGARWRDRIALAIVGVSLLVPLRGLLHYQGPPMEEGFMLAFPEQILHGRYPHRDFLHLYGPGSLWMLAGIFKVLGTTLTVERMVGFAQHAVVAFALFALLRPWGRRVAAAGAVAGVVILITPLGLSAMAWNGALAFALSGLAVGSHLARSEERSDRRGLAALVGVLAGVSLLFRPDLVVAVALGFGVLWWQSTRARRVPMALGAAGALALYVPHLLLAGPRAAFDGMVIQPVFDLRGGRSLPLPPSFGHLDGYLQRAGGVRVVLWPFSTDLIAPQVALWFLVLLAVAAALVVGGWWCRRRGSRRASTLWPMALFGAALVTQAVQRPDTAHLSWVTGVTFPFLIALVAEILSVVHRPSGARARSWLSLAPTACILLLVIPFYPVRTYLDLTSQTFGYHAFGFPIRHGDRVFYYGDPKLADQAQRVVDRLAQDARPGQRLVVGPYDLSKTPYSDAFFYYLFPKLVPGTRYIEMDPGIADARGSGLARELEHSDWLIQSDVWSAWNEPNDSVVAGSPAPNRVVRRDYCRVLDAGKFRLLERC
jgi:hypothetical protein